MMNVKSEILNTKQYRINQTPNSKQYDLEERTLIFAVRVRNYARKLPRTVTNIEIGGQLFRAAGSVGANYIEANEALGKKDFAMRIKISKKESKESRCRLRLSEPNEEDITEKEMLIQEATELMKIFGAISEKSK